VFRAFVLRERLDRLWTYQTRLGVLNFLMGWFEALRWQRLPEMERLGDQEASAGAAPCLAAREPRRERGSPR
jgi:hypothetical protein